MSEDDSEPAVIVREHGHARELRVGMVCASVYAPGQLLTHGYWDVLALPLLWLPARSRCLMLGLGGGTAAHLLRALSPEAHIVAVERSQQVIEVARRDFELDRLGVELRLGDARELLERDTDRYALIIEDIFVEHGGAAHKPAWLPEPGLELAAARLREHGVLVSNNLGQAQASATTLNRLFAHVLRVEVRDSDNQIFLASHAPLDGARVHAAIARHPLVSPISANLSIATAYPPEHQNS